MRERHDPIDAAAQGDRRSAPRRARTTSSGLDKEIRDIVNEAARFAQDTPGARSERALDRHPGRGLSVGAQREDAAAGPQGDADADPDPDAGPVADDDRGQPREVAQEGGRHGPLRRRASPRSRPTRRPWRSRRSTRARWARSWCPAGTEGVAVNTPIAMLLGEGEDTSALDGAALPAPAGRAEPAGRRRRRSRADRRHGGHAASRRRSRREPEVPGGHRDGPPDRARGAARRHGRGDAPRPRRVPDGRGSRRVSGRLQGQPGPARGVRRQAGHRHADHRVRLRRPGRRRRDGRAAGRSSSS